ncbi:hypothetical protein BL243_22705 [Ralstonia solanacearum]|nr:hypothetical protein BL243_22705 [Ralstonia solanacearum]
MDSGPTGRFSFASKPDCAKRNIAGWSKLRWLAELTRTMLNVFYRVAFRKKIYVSIDALQADLDV